MYGINTIKRLNERAVQQNWDRNNQIRWNYDPHTGVATVLTRPEHRVADVIKVKNKIIAIHGLQTKFDIQLAH